MKKASLIGMHQQQSSSRAVKKARREKPQPETHEGMVLTAGGSSEGLSAAYVLVTFCVLSQRGLFCEASRGVVCVFGAGN